MRSTVMSWRPQYLQWPANPQPRRQRIASCRTQVHDAGAPALARPDGQRATRGVVVASVERHDLGAAQARPVEDSEQRAIADSCRGRVGGTDGEERVEL